MREIPVIAQRKGSSPGFVLVTLLRVGVWLYIKLTAGCLAKADIEADHPVTRDVV